MSEWRSYIDDPPWRVVRPDEEIEIQRLSYAPWPQPVRTRDCDIDPMLNVNGLSWRQIGTNRSARDRD